MAKKKQSFIEIAINAIADASLDELKVIKDTVNALVNKRLSTASGSTPAATVTAGKPRGRKPAAPAAAPTIVAAPAMVVEEPSSDPFAAEPVAA